MKQVGHRSLELFHACCTAEGLVSENRCIQASSHEESHRQEHTFPGVNDKAHVQRISGHQHPQNTFTVHIRKKLPILITRYTFTRSQIRLRLSTSTHFHRHIHRRNIHRHNIQTYSPTQRPHIFTDTITDATFTEYNIHTHL